MNAASYYTPGATNTAAEGMATPGVDNGALAQLRALLGNSGSMDWRMFQPSGGFGLKYSAGIQDIAQKNRVPVNFRAEADGTSSGEDPVEKEKLRGLQLANNKEAAMQQAALLPAPAKQVQGFNMISGSSRDTLDPMNMNAYQRQLYLPQGSSQVGGFGPGAKGSEDIDVMTPSKRDKQEKATDNDVWSNFYKNQFQGGQSGGRIPTNRQNTELTNF